MTVDFPCKYASSGCGVSLRYMQKPEHEETCEFRPYSCPCPGASCKWQGSLDQVMPHLMTAHKSITNLQVGVGALLGASQDCETCTTSETKRTLELQVRVLKIALKIRKLRVAC